MKNKLLITLPTIFMVSSHNNYSQFIPKGTLEDRAKKRWLDLGHRLHCAIDKTGTQVINYGETKKKNTISDSCS
jgi:hypothetical protein